MAPTPLLPRPPLHRGSERLKAVFRLGSSSRFQVPASGHALNGPTFSWGRRFAGCSGRGLSTSQRAGASSDCHRQDGAFLVILLSLNEGPLTGSALPGAAVPLSTTSGHSVTQPDKGDEPAQHRPNRAYRSPAHVEVASTIDRPCRRLPWQGSARNDPYQCVRSATSPSLPLLG